MASSGANCTRDRRLAENCVGCCRYSTPPAYRLQSWSNVHGAATLLLWVFRVLRELYTCIDARTLPSVTLASFAPRLLSLWQSRFASVVPIFGTSEFLASRPCAALFPLLHSDLLWRFLAFANKPELTGKLLTVRTVNGPPDSPGPRSLNVSGGP